MQTTGHLPSDLSENHICYMFVDDALVPGTPFWVLFWPDSCSIQTLQGGLRDVVWPFPHLHLAKWYNIERIIDCLPTRRITESLSEGYSGPPGTFCQTGPSCFPRTPLLLGQTWLSCLQAPISGWILAFAQDYQSELTIQIIRTE